MHIKNAYIVKSFKHVSIQRQVQLQLPGMFIVLKFKKIKEYICIFVSLSLKTYRGLYMIWS